MLQFLKTTWSTRGARGGYLLAKSAKDIKIVDILIALEDDIKIVDSKVDNPILNLLFEESKEKTKKIFDLTLADLDKYEGKYNEFLYLSKALF